MAHAAFPNPDEQGDLKQALLEGEGLDDCFIADEDVDDYTPDEGKGPAVDLDVRATMDLLSQTTKYQGFPLLGGLPSGCSQFSEVNDDVKATISAYAALMKTMKHNAKCSGTQAVTHKTDTLDIGLTDYGPSVVTENLGDIPIRHHLLAQSEEATPMDPLAVLTDIVNRYSLNAEQECAFRLIGEHFVTGNSEQLKIYVGGGAGTGKSHVLKAVVELFNRCSAAESILVSAPMGIAAVLISGHTIHSLTMLPKTAYQKDFNKLENIWRNVRWLILDEVSMVSAKLLSEISHQISLARGSNSLAGDKPFGGVNIIYAGDHAQLCPVRAKSVFNHKLVEALSINTAQSIRGLTDLHGAWLTITLSSYKTGDNDWIRNMRTWFTASNLVVPGKV